MPSRSTCRRRSRPSPRRRRSRSTSSTRTTTSSSSTSRPNLVVHPGRRAHQTGTLVNALIAHCGDSLSGIGGERRPGIVHRLDKDTSGLMVVAKNDRAHRRAGAQFASHGRDGEPFERGYLAFVWGAPERPQGTIDRPIDRHPMRATTWQCGRAAGRPSPIGRRWSGIGGAGCHTAPAGRVGRSGEETAEPVASLLACRLETGRTHQIRVHLASIGHPVMGDPTYGTGFRTKTGSARRPMLKLPWRTLAGRLCMLIFCRSSTRQVGEILRFRSELPPDLARLHNELVRGRADPSREFSRQRVTGLTDFAVFSGRLT